MIWIILAIIVAALIIASAIRRRDVMTHFPIQDPSDPNYKLAYKIIDDYIDLFLRLMYKKNLQDYGKKG